MFKRKEAIPLRGTLQVVLISFIFSLAASFTTPIFSLYIKRFVSTDANVGYVVSVISLMLLFYALIVTVSLLLTQYQT